MAASDELPELADTNFKHGKIETRRIRKSSVCVKNLLMFLREDIDQAETQIVASGYQYQTQKGWTPKVEFRYT